MMREMSRLALGLPAKTLLGVGCTLNVTCIPFAGRSKSTHGLNLRTEPRVKGVMPGDRIPPLSIAPSGDGHHTPFETMLELTWTEADFIMHCMELFANGDKEYPFASADGTEIALTTQQIDALFQRVQNERR